MFVYDIIKILYASKGFLPTIPYHLVSDKEMFNAFIHDNPNFFSYFYPNLLSDTILGDQPYNDLKKALMYHADKAIATADDDNAYIPPDWVLSFMLGVPISKRSDHRDIAYLQGMLETQNEDSAFDTITSFACYYESLRWLNRTGNRETAVYHDENIYTRPPSVFGETHVIKSLRLTESSPFNEKAGYPNPFPPPDPYNPAKISVGYNDPDNPSPEDTIYEFSTVANAVSFMRTGNPETGDPVTVKNGCFTLVIGNDTDVTTLNDGMCANMSSLKAVRLSDNITAVPAGCFYSCQYIESVQLGNSIASIGSGAFNMCYKLKGIDIPDSVVMIVGGAFQDCRELEYANLSENSRLSALGTSAFCKCKKLKKFVIPSSLSYLQRQTFSECYMLSELTIPASVTTVEWNAGSGTPLYKAGIDAESLTIYLGNPDFLPWNSAQWSDSTMRTPEIIQI